ncbi:MAG TPA: DUF1015 domain-containing protein, partial [Candidatus Dormibacteraeota bacterium]
MAEVRPFQGIVYDPSKVEMAQVVAPPYDIITADDQKRYYRQDPRNVVRLIAGEVRPSDDAQDNKYTRAAGFFQQWLQNGTLRREAAPCAYIYEERFVDPISGERRRRVGILGVVELEPFGTGILAHERTHARAKADRLSLTRAVDANLSPVFALFQDPRRIVAGLLEPVMREPPRLSVMLPGDEEHRIWVLPIGKRLAEVAAVLRESRLFMADGHHRYETALNYRNRQRQEHPEAPVNAAFNFVLMLLVDAEDPGLVILPTHRLLRDLENFDGKEFLKSLAGTGAVTPITDGAGLLTAM